MRAIWLSVLVWAAAALAPAWACSCVGSSFEEAFLKADLVFEGTVETTDLVIGETVVRVPNPMALSSGDDEGKRSTIFRVTRALKGRDTGTRIISHHLDLGGNCGITFRPGQKYRVFAYRNNGGFGTSSCSATHQISDETDDVSDDWYDDSEERTQLLEGSGTREERATALDWVRASAAWENRVKDYERFIDEYAAIVDSVVSSENASYLPYRLAEISTWHDYEHLADGYLLLHEYQPRAAIHLVDAGEAFLAAADNKGARQAFQKAIELDPDDRQARVGLAKAEIALEGRLTRGIWDYRGLTDTALDVSGEVGNEVDLSGSDLYDLSLAGARIDGLWLIGVKTDGADFRGARLNGARLDLFESRWGETTFASGSFVGATFRYAKFGDPDFTGADLRGADFTGAQLADGQFRRSRIDGASFENADFSRADLSGVDLRKVNLSGVTLRAARLSGADLRGQNLADAKLEQARINCGTRLPDGLDVAETMLIPEESICGTAPQSRDFSGKDWKYADFSDLDLSNANFSEAGFDNTTFVGSNLGKADFSGSAGYGYFQGADLTAASFRNSEARFRFHRSARAYKDPDILPPAILDQADFSGAKLDTVSFLGEAYSLAADTDLSTTVFTDAALDCNSEWQVRTVEEYDPDAVYEWFDPEYETQEDIDRWRKGEKADYDRARAWLAAEGDLVRFLHDKWPSMTFGEECQVYLADTDPFAAPLAE